MDWKIGGLTLRELTGFALLVALLLAGLLSSWVMGRQHSGIARALEDSTWLALSGQWENARNAAQEAKQEWERGRRCQAAIVDQTRLEEIDSLFAELTVYAAAGERTEFARTCAALEQRLEALGDNHRAGWWNILVIGALPGA